MHASQPRQVEIRPIGWRFGAGLALATALLTLGALAWATTGPGVELTLGATAILLAGALLAEYPHRVTFDVDGIERRSLLRRHRIPWGEVDSLERMPLTVVKALDALTKEERSPRGLMVRTVRGSRYVLSPRLESIQENRALHDAVARWAPYCRMNLLR